MKNKNADFIKKSAESDRQALSEQERVALIRKGNEYFNLGNYSLAERIFTTAGSKDGLVRVADKILDKDPLHALGLYKKAAAAKQLETLYGRMAEVVRVWLSLPEGGGSKPD